MNDTEKPLVTFALFAYNQEQFVADAVVGALSQDYQPLQIILSDDGSTDSTYSIMETFAWEYDGPHEIILRKSEINLGTSAHVQAVSEKADGELVIVAAGDDISLPRRVSETVNAWITSGRTASVLHGLAIEIDPITKSETRRAGFRPGCSEVLDMRWYLRHRGLPFISPTCAYSRNVFIKFPPLIGGSVIEDGVLVQRCFLEGPVVPIDSYLILQRVGHDSSGRGFTASNPSKWNRHMRSRTICALNLLQDVASFPNLDSRTKQILERKHLKTIRTFPLFVLPISKPLGFVSRLVMALRICLKYPSTAPILERVYFAVSFTGLAPVLVARLRSIKRHSLSSRTMR